jgi:hypothetical protein
MGELTYVGIMTTAQRTLGNDPQRLHVGYAGRNKLRGVSGKKGKTNVKQALQLMSQDKRNLQISHLMGCH